MQWRYICEDRVSDSYGLAADEAMALRVGENLSSSVLRLYTYRSSSALVGRFQRIENELNLDFCRKQKIHSVRTCLPGQALRPDLYAVFFFEPAAHLWVQIARFEFISMASGIMFTDFLKMIIS